MKALLTLALLTLASPALAGDWVEIDVPEEEPTIAAGFAAAARVPYGHNVRIVVAPGVYNEHSIRVENLRDNATGVILDVDGVTLRSSGNPSIELWNSQVSIVGNLTFEESSTALGAYDDSYIRGSGLRFVHCDAGPDRGIVHLRDSEVSIWAYFDEVPHGALTRCIDEQRSRGWMGIGVGDEGLHCQIVIDGINMDATPTLESSWGQIKASYR